MVNRRFGITIADIQRTPECLVGFERFTRKLEAIHEIAFLGFMGFSIWRTLNRKAMLLDLAVATIVYVSLILSPAVLQRYNRLRVYSLIQRMARR